MRFKSSYKLILFAAFSSLACIAGYDYLPERTLTVHPGKGVEAFLWSDEIYGGNSQASWINKEALHWRCDVRESAKHLGCGFQIQLQKNGKGLDLNQYSSVVMKLALKSEEKRIRLTISEWIPGFSERNNNTTKFNVVNIPRREINGEVVIDMRRFAVGEWWLTAFDVPSEHAYPTFDDVHSFGIEVGAPPQPGVHELQLEKLAFVGKLVSAEDWYRSILLFWIAVLLPQGIVRYLEMQKRLARERRQLEQLASYNNELKDESEKFKELSTTDSLTGVLNRHGFDSAHKAITESLQPGQKIALIIIDLDHFKQINDKRGHDAGDLVLRTVARVVGRSIRSADRLARWGGEEFLILCPNISEAGALTLAEKLREAVASTNFELSPTIKVTTSVGVGCFSPEEPFDQVFKRVDSALYEAKQQGRNRTVLAQ